MYKKAANIACWDAVSRLKQGVFTLSYLKIHGARATNIRLSQTDSHGSHKCPTEFCADLLIIANCSQIGR